MSEKINGSELQSTTDARVWAEQFNVVAQKLGYSKMDEGWLIAWFANAMFAQETACHRKADLGVNDDPEHFMDNIRKALWIASQCWRDPKTSHLVMEPDLGNAFAKRIAPILDKVDELVAENAKLRERVAELEGKLEAVNG